MAASRVFAARFFRALASGAKPEDAVQAIPSTVVGARPGWEYGVFIAWYDTKPNLLLFDGVERSVARIEPGRLVVLGPAKDDEKERVAALWRQLPEDMEASEQTVYTLATLQHTYARAGSIAELGIGGAFIGAWTGDTGCNWMPDVIYLITDGDSRLEIVYVGVRRGAAMCMNHSQDRMIGHEVRWGSVPRTAKARLRLERRARSALHLFKRDSLGLPRHAVILPTHRNAVFLSIADIDGVHKHIRLQNAGGASMLSVTPELTRGIEEDFADPARPFSVIRCL